jgi:small subunit ribosomal protein S20
MKVTRLRNIIKKTEKVVAVNDVEKSKELMPVMIKSIDQAAGKGIIHKKRAARKKSRMMRKLNQLIAPKS